MEERKTRPINVGEEVPRQSESKIESDTVDGEQRALQDQPSEMNPLLSEFMGEISGGAAPKRASISAEGSEERQRVRHKRKTEEPNKII
jgi:hypothetical protein